MIARESPNFFKIFIDAIMAIFFKTALEGATSCIALSSNPKFSNITGKYFHMAIKKEMSSIAKDPVLIQKLLSIVSNLPNK